MRKTRPRNDPAQRGAALPFSKTQRDAIPTPGIASANGQNPPVALATMIFSELLGEKGKETKLVLNGYFKF